MHRWLKSTVLGFALAAPACGGGGAGGGADKNDGALSESDPTKSALVSTYDPTVRLRQGYTPLFEQGQQTCVRSVPDEGVAELTVDDVVDTYQLVLITSREKLATELGIDITAQVKYQSADASAELDVLHQFKKSERSVFVLLRATSSYLVRDNLAVQLIDDPDHPNGPPLEQLKATPVKFLARCGSHYIEGIRYEAKLLIALRFDTQDEELADSIKAQLGLKADSPTIDVDGTVGAQITSTSQREGVEVGVHALVQSSGFSFHDHPESTAALAALENGNIFGDDFAKIDALRLMMGDSIKAQRCRDAGGSECNGQGYFKNTQHDAGAAQLVLAPYKQAINAPLVDENWRGFLDISDTLSSVEDFIRIHTALKLRIEGAYDDEIGPFLQAKGLAQAGFGILPPHPPVYDTTELVPIAKEWEKAFRPDDGAGHVGAVTEGLTEAIERCWSHASIGIFEDCAPPPDSNIADTEIYKEAEAQLSRYQEEGRILPLHYKVVPTAVPAYNAGTACQDLKLLDMPMRLVHAEDVERLALPVAYAPLPSDNPDFDHFVWHEYPTPVDAANCGGGLRPVFFNVPFSGGGAYNHFACMDLPALPALCVPAAGPFGSVEAL